MTSRPWVFTKTNFEGINRVKEGQGTYAFLMESTTIEYYVERECEIAQIGTLLDCKGYGMALPPGSLWKDKINVALTKLREDGRLHYLKVKWWKRKGGEKCQKSHLLHGSSSSGSSQSNSLTMENFFGVFFVLVIGFLVAIIVALMEVFWNSYLENNRSTIPNVSWEHWKVSQLFLFPFKANQTLLNVTPQHSILFIIFRFNKFGRKQGQTLATDRSKSTSNLYRILPLKANKHHISKPHKSTLFHLLTILCVANK